MSKDYSLKLSAIGKLCKLSEQNGGLFAVILVKYSCRDEFMFMCKISKQLSEQFRLLDEMLQNDSEIVIQFTAKYSDVFVHHCITSEDPERIVNFVVELSEVGLIMVDGRELLGQVDSESA